MAQIAISYRREDSGGWARSLYDRLSTRFGDGQVFFDVDTIAPGVDFVKAITDTVSRCEVLLAVIGPRWTTITDERGRRRIDLEQDYVRVEIESALERDIRVIPVLVDNAKMPESEELPPALASLVRRNAYNLDPESFDRDAAYFVTILERALDITPAAPAARAASPVASPAGFVASGAAAGGAGVPMQFAGFGRRLGGYAVDYALIFSAALLLLYFVSEGFYYATMEDFQALMLFTWVGYYWTFNAIGWSPGKRMAGLRLVRADGRAPGAGPGLVRALMSLLSSLPLGLGYFWMLRGDRGQTWHDAVAGTFVVRASEAGQPIGRTA